MCRSTKFVLQSAAVPLLPAPQAGFRVCQLSCHGADRGKVLPRFRGQWLEPCWPRGPAVWHAGDKQLHIMSTTNKNFPFPSLMCQVSLKRGTFWKESLKCLKIMCCIMEWPHRTPRREQARKMMHVGSGACVRSPSSWDVFKWGKMNS